MSSIPELRSIAAAVRKDILKMSSVARAPHIGSALSCVDILTALYFDVARVGPEIQDDPGRDRIILSKGHASAALYACLAERGFLDVAQLDTYCADGSLLAEHPSLGTVPGVEATTGSLGHGLSLGVGMAYAARFQQKSTRVFVVVSDGECNEGSIWEAALWAPRHRMSQLTVIVDFNRFQATGSSTEITQLEPFAEKWRSFGWETVEVDGHDFGQLKTELSKSGSDRPRAVVAHTIKGKGVSFMERNLEWHYRPLAGEDFTRAMAEVSGVI